MSWCERWFLLILVELLTITQWVEVRGDFCWYWWNGWPSFNVLRWEVIFVDMGGIVDHHSMNLGERWFYYQQKSPLTSTHWMMVNNSANINKNHLSPKIIEWWSTIPPISIKITSHINTLSDAKNCLLTITQWVEVRGDFCWYWWNCWPSLNELRWEVIFVDIGGIVDHYSMSWSERWLLNDGQQFRQYQQNSPLT
jgi:hypothetical protein